MITSIIGRNDSLDELTQRVLQKHKLSKQLIRELEAANDVELAPDNFGKAVDHHIRFEGRE
ncbi:hypothetical protein C0389_04430 [bacterium]|nr:hypothetical protein [bacterium]